MLIHLYIYSFSEEVVDISAGEGHLYRIVDEFSVRCDDKDDDIRKDWTLRITHPVSNEKMFLDIFDVEKTDKGWDCAVIPTHESRKEYQLH